MKKIVWLMSAMVMILAMTVPSLAFSLPAFDDDYDNGPGLSAGYLFANKYETILNGQAGSEEDDVHWTIPGVSGDAIPTLDGKVSQGEGYQDFENYEDYISICCKNPDTFTEWYDEVESMNLTLKTCWDGTYLYVYFEYNLANYHCEVSQASNMWRWPCIQFGVAREDAVDAERAELGYTVTDSGDMLCCAWGGIFNPIANEDYVGVLTDVEGGAHLQHEFRIRLADALRQTEAPSTGDRIRMSWLVAAMHGDPCEQRLFEFTTGICGCTAGAEGKRADLYAVVTLGEGSGKGEGAKESVYKPTEADLSYDFNATSSIFFEDIVGANDFMSDTGVGMEYGPDNKYITLSCDSEFGLCYSAGRYPVGLGNAASSGFNATPYAIIKYRTSNKGMTLGLNMLSNQMLPGPGETKVEFHDDNVVYPEDFNPKAVIVADGEWHYALIDISCSPGFGEIVTSIGFEIAKGSIDIEGIRFYGSDPSDLYDLYPDEESDDGTESEKATKPEDVTDADDATQVATDPVTEAQPEEEKKSGCQSFMSSGSVLILMAAGIGTVLFKKKKDQ